MWGWGPQEGAEKARHVAQQMQNCRRLQRASESAHLVTKRNKTAHARGKCAFATHGKRDSPCKTRHSLAQKVHKHVAQPHHSAANLFWNADFNMASSPADCEVVVDEVLRGLQSQRVARHKYTCTASIHNQAQAQNGAKYQAQPTPLSVCEKRL